MHKTTRTVGVLLFENFSNHCLANAVEPLRAANTLSKQPHYAWEFLSVEPGPVRSSSGMPVTPTGILRDHPGGEMLMILSSYNYSSHATPVTFRALRAARQRFGTMIGMDMGAWLLAAAGLLDGHRATVHWDELELFAERFTDVEASPARTVQDGPFWSCGGGTTALELMLDLIAQHHGPMLRLEVGALFMHGEREISKDLPQRLNHTQITEAAVSLMRRHIEAPLPIDAIARRLGLSARALERHFAQALQRSPSQVYRALRLNAARRLAEQTTLSVAEIATRCGYEDPSALTRAFRQEFGLTPRGLRSA
jgi:transcriptional regulator GlxA family with amidase domain